MLQSTYYDSPAGLLKISGSEFGITSIQFVSSRLKLSDTIPPVFDHCLEQLEEYFAKKRTVFNTKISLQGTDFQKQVWTEMLKIPYGKTTSYLAIAQTLGDRKAVRAVGLAAKLNPIAIIVPCHRVIGLNGDLTGYAGGLDQKRNLLMLENPASFGKQQSLF